MLVLRFTRCDGKRYCLSVCSSLTPHYLVNTRIALVKSTLFGGMFIKCHLQINSSDFLGKMAKDQGNYRRQTYHSFVFDRTPQLIIVLM